MKGDLQGALRWSDLYQGQQPKNESAEFTFTGVVKAPFYKDGNGKTL